MSASEQEKSLSILSKRKRYTRARSSDEFSIEELSPDDMGYDADIEVIRPDKYEEAESEFEDTAAPSKNWHSVDEELAARMRQLGREQLISLKSSHERGRKRRSAEMFDDDTLLGVPLSPSFDIQEIVESSNHPSPAKRRRRKSKRPSAAQHILKDHNEGWTDSSEGPGAHDKAVEHLSTSSTPSDKVIHKKDEDDVMMDIS